MEMMIVGSLIAVARVVKFATNEINVCHVQHLLNHRNTTKDKSNITNNAEVLAKHLGPFRSNKKLSNPTDYTFSTMILLK